MRSDYEPPADEVEQMAHDLAALVGTMDYWPNVIARHFIARIESEKRRADTWKQTEAETRQIAEEQCARMESELAQCRRERDEEKALHLRKQGSAMSLGEAWHRSAQEAESERDRLRGALESVRTGLMPLLRNADGQVNHEASVVDEIAEKALEGASDGEGE